MPKKYIFPAFPRAFNKRKCKIRTINIVYSKNPAYRRQRISRPMRLVGPIQFWRACVIFIIIFFRSLLIFLNKKKGKPRENLRKTPGKPRANPGKTLGKPGENPGKAPGKPSANPGKTPGKTPGNPGGGGRGGGVDQWEAGILSCDLRANERPWQKLHGEGTDRKIYRQTNWLRDY